MDIELTPQQRPQGRDAVVLSIPLSTSDEEQLATSWRINQDESLFTYARGEDTSTCTDLTFPDAPARATPLAAADYARARAACEAALVPEGALMEACILDVGITSDTRFAMSAAAVPTPRAGAPAIYRLSKNDASLMVDYVSARLEPIVPDGNLDGVFDVSVQGPIAAFVVATTSADGVALGGSYWDNIVDASIPAEVPGLAGGVTGYVVGVTEQGSDAFLNRADGSLPTLDASLHELSLYVTTDGSLRAGQHVVVWAIAPNGLVSASPVLLY